MINEQFYDDYQTIIHRTLRYLIEFNSPTLFVAIENDESMQWP